jgi:16S rRNA C967 or C1407 C5-methylase (RsmB/RsmF family)
MDRLPKAFIERMKKQLPTGEWEAFFATYSGQPYKGIRANTLKIQPCALA